MDKKMARTNMRMGITLFMVLFLMMGATFVWAAVYASALGQ